MRHDMIGQSLYQRTFHANCSKILRDECNAMDERELTKDCRNGGYFGC